MKTSVTPASNAVAPPVATATPRSLPWMKLAVLMLVVVLAAAAGYWYWVLRFQQTTDDAYVGGNVTVMAPKVSGFIDQILVEDNQHVKAGQVLVRLDSRDYDAKLAQATAEVESAQSAVEELKAKQVLQQAIINQHVAETAASKAELTRSNSDQLRYRELVKDDAVSNQIVERANADFSKAQAAVQKSDAAVIAATRELDVLAAQVNDARARVDTALAAQRVAQLNVEYTVIRAPVDGYIGNRTARVGALANIGVPIVSVVPEQGLWVDANFKEDQLRKMHVGDTADVQLDASSTVIHGRVESLAPATGATFSVLPPENATGNFTKIVQRVPVRIHLDTPKGMEAVLRPGLSSVVTVHTVAGDKQSGS
ncbi:HlyD family secretion protein [Paraburkholderia sp. BL25I1N1]|uniref:HlyD family secretion protein n=1 Tax=Paraburkholderia sp. BL25I1N1 TaxID=1938804 RepID=UPI000D40B7E1|nr:HlyD family secretion protein [Paraburkholderia sp. BL25I1N1]PRY05980.1 membrane fusion protein (multidrug efflux system) [Paraburkholderia sp. BL25I1N1]